MPREINRPVTKERLESAKTHPETWGQLRRRYERDEGARKRERQREVSRLHAERQNALHAAAYDSAGADSAGSGTGESTAKPRRKPGRPEAWD